VADFSALVSDIRAILLDAVGTTIVPASPVSQTYHLFGRRHGSRLELQETGTRFREAFRIEDEIDRAAGYVTSEARERDRWRKIVQAVFSDVKDWQGLFEELWSHFAQPQTWQPVPDAVRFIQETVAKGIRIVLASNFDQRLRTIVSAFAELSALEGLAISSEIGWRKPAPRFYLAVLDRLCLRPEEVLSLGDDEVNDVQGAMAAGLQARLVRR
jgi:putative hydrolase of the HAD superfamily